ncbi:MAG TPA: response regulator transcription factor [Solirubrobacterales bacterium]|nr:response regulator transcription factor [Solirubrobacterales bacterium]
MSAETTVVVVDDHEVLRTGLRYVLEPHNIRIVGDTGEFDEAKQMVAAERPDVVIVDMRLGTQDGVELIKDLTRKRSRVIAYSGYRDERLLARAMEAGAMGYVVKDGSSAELVEGIHAVAQGRRWLPRPMSEEELTDAIQTKLPMLSRREREILSLLSKGRSTEDVADELALSAHTVRTHVKNAMRKLEASTRAHAVAIALRELSIS